MIEQDQLSELVEELDKAARAAAMQQSLDRSERLTGHVTHDTDVEGIVLQPGVFVTLDGRGDNESQLEGASGLIIERIPSESAVPAIRARTLSIANGIITVDEQLPRDLPEDIGPIGPSITTGVVSGPLVELSTRLDTKTGDITIRAGDSEVRDRPFGEMRPPVQARRLEDLGGAIIAATAVFRGIAEAKPGIKVKKSTRPAGKMA